MDFSWWFEQLELILNDKKKGGKIFLTDKELETLNFLLKQECMRIKNE
jgi:hypothetical protein